MLGFTARVSEREQAGRTVYRVRLGPFERKDEADAVQERLKSNAVESALVRVER
jgi:cell division protein FtsN